jgi:hypothetical protein
MQDPQNANAMGVGALKQASVPYASDFDASHQAWSMHTKNTVKTKRSTRALCLTSNERLGSFQSWFRL